MDAGFFDVLHDAADDDVFAVGERVHVNFDGVFEEVVDEDGAVLGIFDGLFHVADDGFFVVGDDHGASAEHVRRTDEHGIADFGGSGDGLFERRGHGAGGLRDAEFVEQLAETLAVFGEVDVFGRGADDFDACGFQREREVERSLSAELDDYSDLGACRSFVLADGEDVFDGERFEVEAVAGVVVGGNRLGIAVDHDGFVAVFAQREAGVAAAVIEFNSLPDAVGPAAEDDDFLLVGGRGFVFFFVGRIKIRRVAFEFGGAGVHALVDGIDAVLLAQVADFFLIAFAAQAPGSGEAAVGESHALGVAQDCGRDRFHRMLFDFQLHVVNFFELVEEPGVDAGHFRDLLDGVALADGVANVGKALGMRRDQALGENFRLDFF